MQIKAHGREDKSAERVQTGGPVVGLSLESPSRSTVAPCGTLFRGDFAGPGLI